MKNQITEITICPEGLGACGSMLYSFSLDLIISAERSGLNERLLSQARLAGGAPLTLHAAAAKVCLLTRQDGPLAIDACIRVNMSSCAAPEPDIATATPGSFRLIQAAAETLLERFAELAEDEADLAEKARSFAAIFKERKAERAARASILWERRSERAQGAQQSPRKAPTMAR